MEKQIFAYYYKSESGDEYLNIDISKNEMTVVEAMDYFGWESLNDWEQEGYLPEEIPYENFMVTSIEYESNNH